MAVLRIPRKSSYGSMNIKGTHFVVRLLRVLAVEQGPVLIGLWGAKGKTDGKISFLFSTPSCQPSC